MKGQISYRSLFDKSISVVDLLPENKTELDNKLIERSKKIVKKF